jgi:hypothetical protein
VSFVGEVFKVRSFQLAWFKMQECIGQREDSPGGQGKRLFMEG